MKLNIKQTHFIYLTIIICIACSFVTLIAILPVFYYYPLEALKYEYNHGLIFSADKTNPIPSGFKAISERKKFKLVLSSFDLIYPKYTLIYSFNDSSINDRFNAQLIYYERVGLLDWKINSYQSIDIDNKSFDQAVEIARNYDLSKENPDPENITVYPAPTQEEIDEIKRRNSPEAIEEYRRKRDYCENELLGKVPEEEYDLCVERAIMSR